jgi:hypothetical protein
MKLRERLHVSEDEEEVPLLTFIAVVVGIATVVAISIAIALTVYYVTQ